jgi:FkbM family methyltransferase
VSRLVARTLRGLHHYANALHRRIENRFEIHRAHRLGHRLPGALVRRASRLGIPAADIVVRLLRFVDPDAPVLLVDVGANEGQWIDQFLGLYADVRIIAFEPVAEAFAVLQRRHGGRAGVELVRAALSDHAGEAAMTLGHDTTRSTLHAYGGPLAGEAATLSPRRETVRLARLDDYADRIAATGAVARVLKIDVQGHELAVLEGAAGVLERFDAVVCECCFAPEYEGVEPSFAPATEMLRAAGLYPIHFGEYGSARSPYAYERDVLFVRRELLDRIWGW